MGSSMTLKRWEDQLPLMGTDIDGPATMRRSTSRFSPTARTCSAERRWRTQFGRSSMGLRADTGDRNHAKRHHRCTLNLVWPSIRPVVMGAVVKGVVLSPRMLKNKRRSSRPSWTTKRSYTLHLVVAGNGPQSVSTTSHALQPPFNVVAAPGSRSFIPLGEEVLQWT